MSEPRNGRFGAFVRACCGELLQSLASVLHTPIVVSDRDGVVLVESEPGAPSEANNGGPCVPIESGGECVGMLAAPSARAELEPLLGSLASQIGDRFGAENDLETLADKLSQGYEELNLLYRSSRILRPEERLVTSSRTLVRETAQLLEERLVVLCVPERNLLAWEIDPGQALRPPLRALIDHPGAIGGVHAKLARARREHPEAGSERRAGSITLDAEEVQYVAHPITVRNELAGFVGLFRCGSDAIFETRELRLLECLAEQLRNAATTDALQEELRGMLFDVVKSLVATIEAKDSYTRGHSERVCKLSVQLAERVGLPPEEIQNLTWSALLHDIGKLAIPEGILCKPGKLTDEEFRMVKSHPVRGCQVLEHIPQLKVVLPGIRNHHERFDGRGYPDRLKGHDIPLIARIISVADTFDAMVSSRAYRRARSFEHAVDEIRRSAGTQLDPDLAATFLELIDEGAVEHPEIARATRDAA